MLVDELMLEAVEYVKTDWAADVFGEDDAKLEFNVPDGKLRILIVIPK